jgi:arginyl-tRNA synthetase
MIQEQIKDLIIQAVESLGILKENIPAFTLEHPDIMSQGDFACNIAMLLARPLKKSPVDIAKQIIEKINENKIDEACPVVNNSDYSTTGVEKVEVAGPGFINFHLTPAYFSQGLKEILHKKEDYGKNNNLESQKTIIEYTDPNPFKDFHIGHLMSNSIGEAISRVVEANGANIIRICYQGDVGLHVAKTIWGVQKMLKDKIVSKKEFFGNFFGLGKNPKIWGRAYALGSQSYEKDEEVKKEITDINKKVYLRLDKEINKIYDTGRKVSLAEFEKIYQVLDTKFNDYFFESQTTEFGTNLVLDNIDNGVFERSDGAVVFKGEKYGLHTRVFINKEGLPTYEAKDLGLAKLKYDRIPYDKSIIITASEQTDYFRVLLKALEIIYPDLAKHTIHIPHGMLRLPSGKMSSRTGQVISGESLLKEIKDNVLLKMVDRKIPNKEKKHIAEIVTVGALKYSILKQTPGKDIIFDLDKSLSFEGDSGPYLQYSCVRAKSILAKAKEEKIQPKIRLNRHLVSERVRELTKMLIRFPEIVERAGQEYSPHYLATYLTELASSFSTFYATETIVDKNDTDSSTKVAITEAFSIVMEKGLDLLGIKVPNEM